MRIFLIGMPGCGKSRTGRILATKINYDYVDMDKYIENQTKKSIDEIFSKRGESFFRELETKALENLSKKDDIVISCGGGIVKTPENKALMRSGITLFLNAPVELIMEHLKTSSTVRPLLKTKSVKELYEERYKLYMDFMDYGISYQDSESAVKKIIHLLTNKHQKKILVVNGPNLNMLGLRDPKYYGTLTLEDINNEIRKEHSFQFDFFQSNHEGAIVDKLQEYASYDGIIINPAAYTHTSVAIHDCLEMISIPKVEVHLSEVDNREPFRRINFVRDVCDECFKGHKLDSYLEAVAYLKMKINML